MGEGAEGKGGGGARGDGGGDSKRAIHTFTLVVGARETNFFSFFYTLPSIFSVSKLYLAAPLFLRDCSIRSVPLRFLVYYATCAALEAQLGENLLTQARIIAAEAVSFGGKRI